MIEELKQVHGQLDTITKSRAFNASTKTSPNLYYAEVAQIPLNSSPANVISIWSMGTTPSIMIDTLYYITNTSMVASDSVNKPILIIEKGQVAIIKQRNKSL
jgi:hypothetical protein